MLHDFAEEGAFFMCIERKLVKFADDFTRRDVLVLLLFLVRKPFVAEKIETYLEYRLCIYALPGELLAFCALSVFVGQNVTLNF